MDVVMRPVPLSPPLKDIMSPKDQDAGNKNGLADAAKTGLSIPFAVTVGALALAAALAFGRLQAGMEYQEKLSKLQGDLTAAQIDVSSLRTSSLMFSQENARLTREIARLENQLNQLQTRGR